MSETTLVVEPDWVIAECDCAGNWTVMQKNGGNGVWEPVTTREYAWQRTFLNALAAARREVETVMKERDEAKQRAFALDSERHATHYVLDSLLDEPETTRDATTYDRARALPTRFAYERATEALAKRHQELREVKADLATARAALEDVRDILRTIADMWDDEKAMHEISATAYEMSNIARRALAQEAGE